MRSESFDRSGIARLLEVKINRKPAGVSEAIRTIDSFVERMTFGIAGISYRVVSDANGALDSDEILDARA